ncbi:flagellar filament capping protein FliD [Granulicella tundricola]|uniref:Flagellar hook-associated protein 2 n=1 Tax=Granulicella tundricola (strain ATCC BAA-1859 / DSM 23138 / MP5ACTX9) TaxID=1198114 RepID=E8WW74_GRATM|nr:flagellar filament capping protein FliD [Granulicella tundricola]ADW68457.1 flagellar hook-associated 2 domain-containing protein [Granulicella tundricola MP5ACTX9]
MGTVGLSFGSATSGAGFDVATTVSSILAIESGVETPWKARLTSLQSQDAAFSSLGTQLSTLSTSLSSLTSFDGLFAAKQGSSSDTDVLTLTSASTSAVAGSHTVVVNNLAQTSSSYSDQITSASDTLGGSLTIAIGSGTQTITLGSSINSLSTLAAAINSGSYGVAASVVTSTTGSRLSLVSNTSGAAGEATITSNLTDTTTSTAVGFTEGQAGKDASLTVDGLATTSASNTVTTAIPGVTFQLLSAPAGSSNTSVQIQITNDNSSLESAVQSFVTAYNAVNSSIAAQEKNDSTGTAEPLYGNPTLSLLQTQLSQALFSGAASGKVSSITQLGLSVGSDGSLSLNTDTLDAALNSNYSDIAGFFQASGSFGQSLTTTLNQLGTNSTTGAISLALAQNSTEELGINTNIANEDAHIATESTALTAELNLANQELQAIPSQIDEVNKLYSAETGYNQTQA